MEKTSLLLCVVSLLISQALFAAPAATTSNAVEARSSAEVGVSPKGIDPLIDREGWSAFGGTGVGFGVVRGDGYQKSPSGLQYSISALLSYQAPQWVLDTGLSWFYSRLTGSNFRGLGTELRTRAALVDISPRYRVTRHWQLGPALNIAFGADTEFGPSVNGQIATYLLGARSVIEFGVTERYPLRFWQQISTDLSIAGRQAYIGMVGIQIGIPFGLAKDESVQTTARAERPAPVSAVNKLKTQDKTVRLALDPQKVFFKTNSSDLKPEVQRVLSDVGQYLVSHQDDWGEGEIMGHADRRGRYEYNLRLSKQRATAVKRALVGDKLLGGKLEIRAFSFTKPLEEADNREAWAKNRRVELVFNDVKDPESLTNRIRPLLKFGPDIKH